MSPSHHDLAYGELLVWLAESGLTEPGSTLDRGPEQFGLFDPADVTVIGLPSHRAAGKTRAELQQLRAQRVGAGGELGQRDRWQSIWDEIRNPGAAIRTLDVTRIPADAIAFYRPFHFEPFDQWGIYVVIPKLLKYLGRLSPSLGSLRAFPPSVLASMVLFDVFHHEFFHHLVECTATTIEVLWPAPNRKPSRVYLEYRQQVWESILGRHEHDPLEEALANAYSYNSFSFISRVRGGYLDGTSRLYQKALERSWPTEPPGYREAASYVKGGQLHGARMLVQRMLSTNGQCQNLPVGILVDAVFPRGHTAFWQKPDIPTYLVGTETDLTRFAELVPAPNETYSTLFWPGDTQPVDAFIKEQKQKEREAKQRARAPRKL